MKTPMQTLFEKFGHLLPDIEDEYLAMERRMLEKEKEVTAPTYETNKYSSFKEAFDGGVQQAMRARDVISAAELEAWMDEEKYQLFAKGGYLIVYDELKQFINSKTKPH
jgi:hypothetical protein